MSSTFDEKIMKNNLKAVFDLKSLAPRMIPPPRWQSIELSASLLRRYLQEMDTYLTE